MEALRVEAEAIQKLPLTHPWMLQHRSWEEYFRIQITNQTPAQRQYSGL